MALAIESENTSDKKSLVFQTRVREPLRVLPAGV